MVSSGSCFPKDTLSLVRTAQEFGSPVRIVETVLEVNENRKRRMVDKIIAACGDSVENRTIAVLGLTFKPNTDDMRDAPSLVVVPGLMTAGATVRAFDPEGMEEAKRYLDNVVWCPDAYTAADGADALVILTEWNEFRGLDFERMKQRMKVPLLIDLRNIYNLNEVSASGFRYVCVGRGTTPPGSKSE